MVSHLHYAGAALTESLVSDSDGRATSVTRLGLERQIVIAFVGMAFEAKIAAGPGVQVLCRTARSELPAITARAARQGYRGIISFGVAGGLASKLRAGDWVVGSSVLEAQTRHHTDAAWSSKLVESIEGATYAPIMGVDEPIAEPAHKRELHRSSGAAAVDMESHMVARLAAAHGLAFAAVRVIVDPAHRPIPPAAIIGMGANGRTDFTAILRNVARRPLQLSPLARLAVDAIAARAELLRVRRLLGPHFGLVELASTAIAAE